MSPVVRMTRTVEACLLSEQFVLENSGFVLVPFSLLCQWMRLLLGRSGQLLCLSSTVLFSFVMIVYIMIVVLTAVLCCLLT